jgi:hypothetical protein
VLIAQQGFFYNHILLTLIPKRPEIMQGTSVRGWGCRYFRTGNKDAVWDMLFDRVAEKIGGEYKVHRK